MEKGYIAGLVLFYLSSTSALICLSCSHVADVRECLKVEECAPHQRCFSNLALDQHGIALYTLGCTDQSCCSYTDGCNKDLCAATRPTNLRCMTCSDVSETKFCDSVSECSSEEYCFAHKSIKHSSGRLYYELGCMGVRQCESSNHAYLQSCFTCCNQSDFCNHAACDAHFSTDSPAGHSYTTYTTISTVPTTTTPAPQVVIQGKANENYMSIASLVCITVPPAQSYSWKFNGTSRLPPHVFKVGTSQGSAMPGTETLVIANLTEATFGTYTCVASINGQTVESTHFIGIIAEKPTATIEKTTVTNNFALQCKSTGYPMPHLEWNFTPSRIGSHGIPPGLQFSDEGYISTLFVNNYSPRDHDGIWFCSAKNSQGNAVANVHIP